MSDLPKGWKETRLGEIVEIVNGGTPSTSNEDYWNGDILWITPKDLSNFEGRYISKGEKSITKEGLKNSSAKILPKNTILFSSRAPIGYVAIAKQEVSTNQGFKNIICDEVATHYLYMYYWLHNNAKQIEKLSSGSTFSEASTSLMKSLNITIPKIEEQKEIASILSSFDKKIELLKEQNQTLETMAQTIFKEWFIDFNYPNATGEMIDSEMGEIPKGWKIFKLGEVASLFAGGDKPDNTTDIKTDLNKIPVYSNGIRNEGLYGFTDIPKILKESVTISARGTIGYVCLRTEPYVPIVRLISIIPIKQYMSNIYLYLWLKKEKISGYGSTQQQLTIPVFKERKIILPPYELMEVFSQKIDSLYNKRKHNFEQIQTLEETRDSLLPKLMSGKIRIKGFKID